MASSYVFGPSVRAKTRGSSSFVMKWITKTMKKAKVLLISRCASYSIMINGSGALA